MGSEMCIRDRTDYALGKLTSEFGETISIFGPKDATERGGVISFTFDGAHPHDISQVLDEENICIRAGHHCAKPLMQGLERWSYFSSVNVLV